ncbi:unnamed protein product, partial [Rotaria socialis]
MQMDSPDLTTIFTE